MNSSGTPATRDASAVSDEELLARYRDHRDQQAFAQLVHRYEKPLYNYLVRYLGDAETAKDAFQGTFLRVHAKCDTFTAGRRVRPWIYSIATHLAIDLMRRAGHRPESSLNVSFSEEDKGELIDLLRAKTPSPTRRMEIEERRRWTQKAVENLPDNLRTVILLIFFQGLRYREVAEALDIPLGTVKSRVHKALVTLHKAWATDHQDAED